MVRKAAISVPFSKMKFAIAKLLSQKGFVGAVSEEVVGSAKKLNVVLLYGADGQPVISDVKRISKPGRRIYTKSKEIKRFRRGFGLSVFSTPKGIMADADAKKTTWVANFYLTSGSLRYKYANDTNDTN